jgi:hypothetical protein
MKLGLPSAALEMDIDDECVVIGVPPPPPIYCKLSTSCPHQNARHRAGVYSPHRLPKELVPPPAFK